MTGRDVVLPVSGRAGLGNELFPFLRAVERARSTGAVLLPPRWFQLRIGPTLRGERDRRQYQLLFRRAPLTLVALRDLLGLLRAICRLTQTALPQWLHVEQGMGAQFADLKKSGKWYRKRLQEHARPGIVRAVRTDDYLSVHIRLGDFAQDAGTTDLDSVLQGPNIAAPVRWYGHWIERLALELPGLPIVVSSDGTDAQLDPVLSLPGVERSTSANALDEMIQLSHAVGIVGSRSTFSAWGAFLGEVPMLVPLGGDQYRPHPLVWEAGSTGADDFLRAVRERIAR